MYLSRIRIKNYRSIKELDLGFRKGKNIIVGKNNAGKSNLISAIDLILGEASPAYQKSENITENDFHSGNSSESILIFGVLEREQDEQLNYDEIYKCFGFKFHAKITGWTDKKKPIKEAVRHKLSPNLNDFWTDLEGLFEVDDDNETEYVNPKLRNQQTFENQLDNKYLFAFAFRAVKADSKKIQKEIRFFYKEDKKHDWVMAFSAPIRTEFLQSAIIPSFRDPQNELRVSQWTWYGKLLKNYINADDPNLSNAFQTLKTASDGVFKDLRDEINNSKVKVAFPDTSISFQFNPDTKLDVYKSALIYVDDGFNSLLQDKGSGIQSAVIIGLFHYYTRNIAHNSCSLLAIEEPEVYLHPQARRVISNRIDDFLEDGKNQVIMTTHSTEFITTAHESLSVILTQKSKELGTVATNVDFTNSKDRQILVKNQNAEMFFADRVILVEGGEKYILEAYAKEYGKSIKSCLGVNWLNDKNCSVIPVSGKTEFWKYYKKLTDLGIKVFILADFDFFLRQLDEFFTNTKILTKIESDELKGIKGKLGDTRNFKLAKEVIEKIEELKVFLEGKGFSLNDKDIKSKLKEPFRIKKMSQINPKYQNDVKKYLVKLREKGIFILENELEDYFSDECRGLIKKISGKEETPIYIVSELIQSPDDIYKYVNCGEYREFFEMVTLDWTVSQNEKEDSMKPK